MTPEVLRARTKTFAVETVKFVRSMPKDEASRVMAKQLIRCTGSVGANYRSACLAKSPADMIAKLKIVEEEADECGFWFEVIQETETMPVEKTRGLHKESNEIFKIMAASIVTLKKKL